jgi:hypothetical protein
MAPDRHPRTTATTRVAIAILLVGFLAAAVFVWVACQ